MVARWSNFIHEIGVGTQSWSLRSVRRGAGLIPPCGLAHNNLIPARGPVVGMCSDHIGPLPGFPGSPGFITHKCHAPTRAGGPQHDRITVRCVTCRLTFHPGCHVPRITPPQYAEGVAFKCEVCKQHSRHDHQKRAERKDTQMKSAKQKAKRQKGRRQGQKWKKGKQRKETALQELADQRDAAIPRTRDIDHRVVGERMLRESSSHPLTPLGQSHRWIGRPQTSGDQPSPPLHHFIPPNRPVHSR